MSSKEDDNKYNQNELEQEEKKKRSKEEVYAPDRPLPQDKKHKRPIPDSNVSGPHIQLGTRDGHKGKYPQAREFDEEGKPIRDIDFTDHGYPQNHLNPINIYG